MCSWESTTRKKTQRTVTRMSEQLIAVIAAGIRSTFGVSGEPDDEDVSLARGVLEALDAAGYEVKAKPHKPFCSAVGSPCPLRCWTN